MTVRPVRPVRPLGRRTLAVLTPEQVEEVRRLLAAGFEPLAIADRYAVTARTIRRIRDGETWQEPAVDEASPLVRFAGHDCDNKAGGCSVCADIWPEGSRS